MRAHADGGGRLNFQNVVGVTLIDNAQVTKQAALIHQPGEARPQLAQVHFAQRLPGQLHQLGPQAVVILIIHTDEALLFSSPSSRYTVLFGIPSSAIIVAALQGPMRPIKLRISIARVSAGTFVDSNILDSNPEYWNQCCDCPGGKV